MLDSFRRVASNMVSKAFLFVIAISFVLWGVGDIFRGHVDTDVAKIGKTSITRPEYNQELRIEINRMQRRLGTELTPEQIKALQLEEIVLERMINRKLVQISIADMGISVGTPAVLSHIQENSAFQNDKGVFDKKQFETILQGNGLNEASYVALLRKDMTTDFLMETLSTVKIVPTQLIDQVYRYKMERRLVEAIRIPHNHKSDIPAPKETELKTFYDAHKAQFMTPEMRSFSYITLSVDDLLEGIATSETEAKTEYDENIASYQMPEKRTIDNLVFTNEAQAKAAWEQLKTAKNFAAKAKEITKLEEKDRTLGSIPKEDLPTEAQDLLFGMKENSFTKPVKTSLGWHIFRVTAITPAKTAEFSQVREQIIKAITHKKAEDSLTNYSKKLEDEFASGSTLEEAATKFGLKVRTVENVTKEGTKDDGSKAENLLPYANFLPIVFSSEEGNDPVLTLAPDNSSYFVIRVNKVTAPYTRSFEQARTLVAEDWKEQQGKDAIAKLADNILRMLKLGRDIEEVASLEQVEYLPPKQVERPADTLYGALPTPLPASLLREAFTLKPGEITGLHQNKEGDYLIGILRAVTAADPEKDKKGMNEVKLELNRAFASDITEQYMHYLHKHYPVTVAITPNTEKEQQAN